VTFKIRFADAAIRDFDLIFDHLAESYSSFGESLDSALAHAARRVMEIRAAIDRIAHMPHQGTKRDDVLPGVRHLTIDSATYWFDVDEPRRTVLVLGIFFGGQDHQRHMLIRLLGDEG